MTTPTGLDACFHRDDGTQEVPGQDAPWEVWLPATGSRAWCFDNPLLDWLEVHGEAHGFERDDPGDERTDMPAFVLRQGQAFEAQVLTWLEARHELRRITAPLRTRAAVEATWAALCEGVEVIAHGALWDPQRRMHGQADLLVRSDVLHRRFPEAVDAAAAHQPAPHLPDARWHYRVVDVKFKGLHLTASGHAASDHRPDMVQVWIYSQALARMQGLRPAQAHLLGRGWTQQDRRGRGAFERLACVDLDHAFRDGRTLEDLATGAQHWRRDVVTQGASWQVLPVPSRPELRPNLRAAEQHGWRTATRHIATALEDLTTLPRVGPAGRAEAAAAGVTRWTDDDCTAAACGITAPTYATRVDAVLAANRLPPDANPLLPARVTADEAVWRHAAPVEFFVDFETVSDLDDDFATFPDAGGTPMIFMVGCGHVDADGAWQFRVFTADRLVHNEEIRILDAWVAHMQDVCATRDTSLDAARLYHWSRAERSVLETGYNAAAVRCPGAAWTNLPWYDLLTNVVEAEPMTVQGAWGFGLKPIAKALHAHGLIATSWEDGPTDGLGAMVGAWWCDAQARAHGGVLRDEPLMLEIEGYNEVDCRVMQEILHLLRAL